MKSKNFWFLLFLFFGIINIQCKKSLYRCGVDDKKIKILPAKNYVKITENHPAYRRRMNSQDFGDFHIYLDLVNIKNDIKKFHLEEYESLYINALNKAVKILESLLKVKKSHFGYTFKDEQIEDIQIYDWNKTIVGSNAEGDMASRDIDLIIFGRFDNQMGGTLASAGPSYEDYENNRPLVGVVNINANIKYSRLNSEYALTTLILHEFIHILGFLKYHFENYYKNIFSKTDEDGVVRHYINSPKVLEVAKKYFNCPTIDGVELEDYGGVETVGSH